MVVQAFEAHCDHDERNIRSAPYSRVLGTKFHSLMPARYKLFPKFEAKTADFIARQNLRHWYCRSHRETSDARSQHTSFKSRFVLRISRARTNPHHIESHCSFLPVNHTPLSHSPYPQILQNEYKHAYHHRSSGRKTQCKTQIPAIPTAPLIPSRIAASLESGVK